MIHDPPPLGIDLSGSWLLSDESGEHQTTMDVPGDVISALHSAGLINDPYWGRNEYDLRWIAERDWTLRKSVVLERTDQVLVLSGLDCVARVRVNGAVVCRTKNAFRSFRVDLQNAARVGENQIEITLHSPVLAAKEAQDAQPFYVPYSFDNSPIPNGNMLRKPQCDFGWDWNIALAPIGVWEAPRIEPATDLRLARLGISQQHGDSGVQVTVTAHLDGASTSDQSLVIHFDDRTHTEQVPAGSSLPVTVSFQISDPQLWWPVGLGDQPLYPLVVTLGTQIETRHIGLRQITHDTTPDAIGAKFAFAVNDHPVFARGANWIPADALSGRVNRAAVADLLKSAVDANMNMIRVWGGGRYEPDWFYDLCDQMGLLVWQDCMFACNLYPSTPEFLTEVDAEIRENTARLHHHACIAIWCGDNELVGALNWFKESTSDRDRYLASYDRLNRTIELALHETDPSALWWPSSPSRGTLDFGDGWHDDTSGDMHFWSVWHEGRDFEHYRDVGPRFCSEFGFQSYPSMDVIRKFADPSDFNISAPVLESHQKNAGGNARIAETMFRYFRFPQGFENFVYLSQVQQGLAIKTAVTHWRSLKPRCMGTLIWQLNDTWPVASWSSLDHGGGWKLLHHMAKQFYATVSVNAVPAENEIRFVAINDGREVSELNLSVTALSMDGTQHPLATGFSDIGVDESVTVLVIPRADFADDEMLVFRWQTSGGLSGVDHFAPLAYKSYDLPDPGIELSYTALSNGQVEATLTCAAPAFFVALEADCPGRFSDNAVLLLPGHPRNITFTPDPDSAAPRLIVRDLHSATCLPT